MQSGLPLWKVLWSRHWQTQLWVHLAQRLVLQIKFYWCTPLWTHHLWLLYARTAE